MNNESFDHFLSATRIFLSIVWVSKKKGGNMMEFTGLESAVKDYNLAAHAIIVMDKETLEVWTDVFEGPNTWKVYHDDNVVNVLEKHAFYPEDITITVTELKERCLAIYEDRLEAFEWEAMVSKLNGFFLF